jgi:hypothetical protein
MTSTTFIAAPSSTMVPSHGRAPAFDAMDGAEASRPTECARAEWPARMNFDGEPPQDAAFA